MCWRSAPPSWTTWCASRTPTVARGPPRRSESKLLPGGGRGLGALGPAVHLAVAIEVLADPVDRPVLPVLPVVDLPGALHVPLLADELLVAVVVAPGVDPAVAVEVLLGADLLALLEVERVVDLAVVVQVQGLLRHLTVGVEEVDDVHPAVPVQVGLLADAPLHRSSRGVLRGDGVDPDVRLPRPVQVVGLDVLLADRGLVD